MITWVRLSSLEKEQGKWSFKQKNNTMRIPLLRLHKAYEMLSH